MIDRNKEARFNELIHQQSERVLSKAETEELEVLDSYTKDELRSELAISDSLSITHSKTMDKVLALLDAAEKRDLELTLREALLVEHDMCLLRKGRWMVIEYDIHGGYGDYVVYHSPRHAREPKELYRGIDINEAYKILKGDDDDE